MHIFPSRERYGKGWLPNVPQNVMLNQREIIVINMHVSITVAQNFKIHPANQYSVLRRIYI